MLIYYFSMKMMEEASLLLHLLVYATIRGSSGPWDGNGPGVAWGDVILSPPTAVSRRFLSFSYFQIIIDAQDGANVAQRGPACPGGPCLSLRVGCPSALLGASRGEPCLVHCRTPCRFSPRPCGTAMEGRDNEKVPVSQRTERQPFGPLPCLGKQERHCSLRVTGRA